MEELMRQIEQLKMLAMGFIIFAIVLIVILIIMFVKFGFYKRMTVNKTPKRKQKYPVIDEEQEDDESEMRAVPKKPEKIKRAVDIDEGADETAVLDEDDDDDSETFTLVRNVVKTHTTESID